MFAPDPGEKWGTPEAGTGVRIGVRIGGWYQGLALGFVPGVGTGVRTGGWYSRGLVQSSHMIYASVV